MKPDINDQLNGCSLSDIKQVIKFVFELVRSEEGFEKFALDEDALFQLEDFVIRHIKHPMKQASPPLSPAQFSENIIDAFKYLRGMSSYKAYKRDVDWKNLPELLKEKNIPRENLIPFDDSYSYELGPADCRALKDWPEKRIPANGENGRLENAGDYIRRIFREGFYSEQKFGRLYLSDLRKINPKLYQALIQWQKRSGEKLEMLGTKSEAVQARKVAYEQGKITDYENLSRVHSSTSRHRKKATGS